MPCNEERNRVNTSYDSDVDPDQLNTAKRQIIELEAALCALFNELERRGIVTEIVAEASKNGEVDLAKLWDKHSMSDVSRLVKLINSISKDEQGLLRTILDKLK